MAGKRICWLIRAILVLSLGQASCVVAAGDPLAPDARTCAAMQRRSFEGGRIVAATLARVPYSVRWVNSSRIATAWVPFCRLEGVAAPGKRSHVGFEVWLPVRSSWNGRFLAVGAGGSMGDVNRLDLVDAVNRGFAAVATDNGHRSPAPRERLDWALGEWDRILDFGYRGHVAATRAGKAATRAFYGEPARYSYMVGCSQGGQKGLMMAQRYPEEFDGILAGAPVASWVGAMTQQAWTVRALTATPGSELASAQLQALQEAARRRCAGPNGLIADPRTCGFDPAELECGRVAAGAVCLSPDQVTAVRRVYSGPQTSSGESIYPGFPRGSERGWSQLYGAVSADGIVGGGSWLGVYRYMVFDDPTWTLPQLDFDRDPALARRKLGQALDPDDPNLDAFAQRGGKLLVFHGWSDQQVPALASVQYHDAVIARSRRDRVDQFFRLFMVPGMGHCSAEIVPPNSPPALGPNLYLQPEYDPDATFTPQNDALTALIAWVEQARAPDELVVRIAWPEGGLEPRSVRACAEPRVARYTGSGDPQDAAHWTCR